MKKVYILPILFIVIFVIAGCKKELKENVTVDEWKEDFIALREAFEEYNPALYEFNSKERFNAVFDSLYATIKDTSWLSFFRYSSRLGAEMNEAHLTIGSSKAPFRRGFNDGTFRYMPLGVFYLEDKLYLWKQVTPDTTFAQGDEILAINGRGTKEIIAEISQYILTDGHINTYRNRTIKYLFPWLYYWYVERPESFEITFRKSADGEILNVLLPAMTTAEIGESAKNKFGEPEPEKEDGDKFHKKFYDNDIAYLKLKSFDWRIVEEYNLEADQFYNDFFSNTARLNIGNLVIDLRGNTGGRREFADAMIPYINKKNYKGVYFESRSYDGDVTQYETPENSKFLFKGDIYVLTDGGTFSSGASLAIYLKELGNAIVIGEETGGRYEGFAAGSLENVFLPNSGVLVKIPRYKMVHTIAVSQKTTNRGLLPDYPVTYNKDEFINNVDKEYELVKQLITGKEGS